MRMLAILEKRTLGAFSRMSWMTRLQAPGRRSWMMAAWNSVFLEKVVMVFRAVSARIGVL